MSSRGLHARQLRMAGCQTFDRRQCMNSKRICPMKNTMVGCQVHDSLLHMFSGRAFAA